MRQVIALVFLLIGFGWTAPARADMWERAGTIQRSQQATADPSGFTYRGGTNFIPPPGGGGTIVDLGGDMSKGCSAFDFTNSFRALFDANAAERYTTGLVTSALSSAPVVLLCYMSPTLCDAYKHLKALSQAQLATNQQACEAVQTGAEGFGRAMRNTAVKACLDQEAAAGTPIHVAVDKCNKLDPGQSIVDLKGAPIGNGTYSVIDKALETAGASPGEIALAKSLGGQITFSATGPGGKALIQPPPPGAVMAKYEEYFRDGYTKLDLIVKRAAAGQPPTDQDLRELGGFGITVTPGLIAALSRLRAVEQQLAEEKLAAALARLKLGSQIVELESKLRSAAAGERGGYREDLERTVNIYKEQREQVKQIEATQNALAEPAKAIFEEAERAYNASRALTSPAPASPTNQPQLRGPRGGAESWPGQAPGIR